MVLAVLHVWQGDNIRLIHLQRDLHLLMDQLYATHVRCAVLEQGYNLTVQLQETQYVTRVPLVNTRRYHPRDRMQRVFLVISAHLSKMHRFNPPGRDAVGGSLVLVLGWYACLDLIIQALLVMRLCVQ